MNGASLDFEIRVDRMRLHARHGVMAQERLIGNDFEVSVSVMADVGPDAYMRDSLGSTVSYADIVGVVKEEMAVDTCLLEHVCWRIATRLRDCFDAVTSATVTVAKLTPPIEGTSLRSCSATLTLSKDRK